MKKPNVYCLALCRKHTCPQHQSWAPIYGDHGTADFSDRCSKYVKVGK